MEWVELTIVALPVIYSLYINNTKKNIIHDFYKESFLDKILEYLKYFIILVLIHISFYGFFNKPFFINKDISLVLTFYVIVLIAFLLINKGRIIKLIYINYIIVILKIISVIFINIYLVKLSEEILTRNSSTNILTLRSAALFIGMIMIIIIHPTIKDIIKINFRRKETFYKGYYKFNEKILEVISEEVYYKEDRYYFIDNPVLIDDKKRITIISKDDLIKIEVIEEVV